MIKNILIVEDDPFIGDMYVRSLRRAGYTVELISNGSEGLQAAMSGNFDLLLLDIMLPDKKGTEILQTLRGNDHDLVPNARIIILTNFDQDEESKAAMQSRADAYLIKADITPRKLEQIIKSLG